MKKRIFTLTLAVIFLAGIPTVASADAVLDGYISQVQMLLELVTDLQKQLASLIAAQNAPQTAAKASVPITVVSPNLEGTYAEGYPLEISWQGGKGKVQIGIVDENFDANGAITGWMSLSEKPSASVVWDGKTITDITGTVPQKLSSRSAGPYKVLAVSENSNGVLCTSAAEDCNFDVGDESFSLKLMPSIAPGGFSVSCAPSSANVEANNSMTWTAQAHNGVPPFSFFWNGADGISKLPSRSTGGEALDVVYFSPGTKFAMVTAVDASARVVTTGCSPLVSVGPARAPLTILSPNGGETFTMTKTTDPSQFIHVSWRIALLPTVGNRMVHVGLQDIYGRVCELATVPVAETEAFLSPVKNFGCRSTWQLGPGQYKVRVVVEGYESTLLDTSDGFITLVPPLEDDAQTVTPSATSVASGSTVTFKFTAPPTTVRSTLYLFCPSGVTATAPNVCNRSHDVTTIATSSTGFSAGFVNTNQDSRTVTANFYVYLPNNPSYGRGAKTEIAIASGLDASSKPVKVTSPNGGEQVWLGTPYTYKFSPSSPGTVDLSLIPHPAVDASRVCQLATGVFATLGSHTYTIPRSGACVKGPAKTVLGSYKLLVTHRNGDTTFSTDSSDTAFTVAATSSPQ